MHRASSLTAPYGNREKYQEDAPHFSGWAWNPDYDIEPTFV